MLYEGCSNESPTDFEILLNEIAFALCIFSLAKHLSKHLANELIFFDRDTFFLIVKSFHVVVEREVNCTFHKLFCCFNCEINF